MDLALHKQFRLTERFRLQFRAESFNVLSRTNFSLAPPGTVFGTWPATVFGTPSFGVISAAEDPRVVQFALKLYF